ncbi:MAG: ComEC/Rec2 family competence protein [Chloroflexota bacterium]|nr:ComEC/Rec2 family competence protein [Chloroflexota bacterium]
MATRLALPGALVGLALGILAADSGAAVGAMFGSVLVVVLAAAMALVRHPAGAIAAAALAVGLLLGAWRGGAVALPTGPGSVPGLIGRGELRLVGTVVDDPRPRGSSQQVVLEDLIAARAEGPAHRVRGRLLATLPRSVPLAVGLRVALEAEVEAPAAFDGFDYPAYLARQGIGGLVRVREARVLDGPERAGPAAIAAAVRGWLLGGLNEMVPEPEAALGAGILLGVRSSISPEIATAFATAGLTHVVAISGWNIAIVAAIVASLARPLEERRGGRWLAPAAAGGAIAGYVILTGGSPSVVRAALMAGAMMVARLGGSRAHAASALGLAALLMLLVAPTVLWDVGFQLSALATGGLILFAAPIEARLAGWPAWLREPVALTLAAQLTTLPVVVASFGQLSLVAPAANVVVVPLVPMVMLLCAIAAPLGAIATGLHLDPLADAARWAVGGTAWLVLRAMIVAGQAAASVPFAALPLAAPGWLALAWYPALALGWRRFVRPADLRPPEQEAGAELMPLRPAPHRSAVVERLGGILRGLARPMVGLAVVGTVLAAITIVALPDGRLHLVMLDIGQGDSIMVTAPSGATLLVDGGADPDLLLRRLGERLPWWQRRIDVMILTHPHEDHVAGLVAALERYRVGLVLDAGRHYHNPTYPRFVQLAREEPGGRLVAARAGQRIRLDRSTVLTILYPTAADVAGGLPEGDINNASVVGLLQSGSFTALLTGDAEAPVEAMLAERGLLTGVDLLKVGHHGSNSSSSPLLLGATAPRVALISAGVDNDYGHPHQVTLDHLRAIPGLRVHRTDLEGSLEVVSDGLHYEVRSRVGIDPWRLVVGAPITAGRAARSIGPWPSHPSPRPSSCSPPSTCPMGSSPTRAASAAWRPRQRGSWSQPGWSSIRTSSRSPPCCTTSTNRRLVPAAASTGSSARGG